CVDMSLLSAARGRRWVDAPETDPVACELPGSALPVCGESALDSGALKELVYRFELDLESSPEQLWPLVSDTNRFNRDAGVPAVERRGVGRNARRRLRLARYGVPIEWEEEPFEWVS